MTWGFEDIPRLVAQFEADWLTKHPDFKPSYTGCKITIDDQYERDTYGQAVSCLETTIANGVRVQVPSARNLQPSIYYQEREALKEIYDERQF